MKSKAFFLFVALIFCAFMAGASPFYAMAQTAATGEVMTAGPNDILIETSEFEALFSKEGASLKNYRLKNKKFRDLFVLETSSLMTSETELTKLFSVDMNLVSKTGAVLLSDNMMSYDMKREKIGSVDKLIFTGNISAGSDQINLIKTYTIDNAQKLIKLSVKVKNTSGTPVTIGNADHFAFAINFLSSIDKNTHDDELIADFGGSLYKAVVNAVEYKHEFKATDINATKWLGVRDSYYSAIISFDDKKPVSASVDALKTGELKDKMGFASAFKLKFSPFTIDAGESETYNFSIFMGVKTYDELKKFNRGFEEICEFNFLALLILQSLFFFYGLTKNYGLSIILLTIAIKLLLQPLTNKQARSMKEMQKIQPYIAELKKKYPEDLQKQNEEVMKLYKEHGINPFGGCLPLLLQLPILFALFTALRASVELKGEGFLWLADLSLADPTWILPIAIALSMHVQQSQMQVDPNQAAAFQFMPVFMFFVTYTLPAGVLLYWGVSNVLQVVQQWYDKRNDAAPANNLKQIPEAGDSKNRKGGKNA